jgi:hypothetical protein
MTNTRKRRAANEDDAMTNPRKRQATAVAAMRVAMRHALNGTPNSNRQYALLKDLAPAYAMLKKRLPVKKNMKNAENVVMQRRIANRTTSPYVQVLKNSDNLTDVRYALRQVTNASMITTADIARRLGAVAMQGNTTTSPANLRRVQVITELIRAGAGASPNWHLMRNWHLMPYFRDILTNVTKTYIATGHRVFYDMIDAFASRGMLRIKTGTSAPWATQYVKTGRKPYIMLIELVLSKKVLTLKDVLPDRYNMVRDTLADAETYDDRTRRWSRLLKVFEVMVQHGLNTADFLVGYFSVVGSSLIEPRYTEMQDLIRLGAAVDARPAGRAWGTPDNWSMLDHYIYYHEEWIEGAGEADAPRFNEDILKFFQRAGLTTSRRHQLPPAYTAMLAKYKLVSPSAVKRNTVR